MDFGSSVLEMLRAYWPVILFVAIGLIIFGLRTWIKSYIDQRIKSSYEKDLEALRSDLRIKETKITALQSNVLGGRAGRQAILNKRKIEAAEALWDATLKYDKFNMAVQSVSLLKLGDLATAAKSEENVRNFLGILSGFPEGDLKDQIPVDSVELHRPFLPEETWNVYRTYKAVMVFCFLQLKVAAIGIDDADKIFDEEGVISSIKEVMPHMADFLDRHKVVGVPHVATPLRELVLSSIRSVIFSNQSDLDDVIASKDVINAMAQLDAEFVSQSNEP